MDRLLWIDASAGVAGDMLLGALVDAGVPLATLQAAVDAVLPAAVRLSHGAVLRAGLRASKVDVEVLVADPPHRTWTTVRGLLERAELDPRVRTLALGAFERLADAEGRVHGVAPDDVHFHEVGALDAIADVVGACAGVVALGVAEVVCSPVALGSGTIAAAHGTLPVPAPAVLELARGREVLAGGTGELATPTGLALLTSLAPVSGPLPALRVESSGIGAGTRDTPGRANVVRLVVGTRPTPATGASDGPGAPAPGALEPAVLLEANVDDLDPRVWPEVLARLLAEGAADAWLTPILMKKGRPAHTVHVLAEPSSADRLSDALLEHTTTLGVRRAPVERDVLARDWRTVDVDGATVRIKVGHRAGRIRQAMPEFDDVVAAAAHLDAPVERVLAAARSAAEAAGLRGGAPWPVAGA